MKTIIMPFTQLDGNLFSILGKWQDAAKSQGLAEEEIDEVIREATSGGYDTCSARCKAIPSSRTTTVSPPGKPMREAAMLDRFLAIEGINPDVALMAALSKEGYRLQGVVDELERLPKLSSVRGTIHSGYGAAGPDLMRIATWLAGLAKVMNRLSKFAGSSVGLPEDIESQTRNLTHLLPTLDRLLDRHRRLRRSVKELDRLIQSLSADCDAADGAEVVQALKRQRDQLKEVIAEMYCIGTFVGSRIGLPFSDRGRGPRRPTGCKHPEQLALIRDFLQSGHTLPQMIGATGIPKGVAYYLFHRYLAKEFPHAIARQVFTPE